MKLYSACSTYQASYNNWSIDTMVGHKQFISRTTRMGTLDLSRWKTYCILQTLRFGHNKLCPQQLRIPVSRNHKYMFYIVVFRHMVF